MRYSMICNKSYVEPSPFDRVTNEVIIPIEMSLGLILQVINLMILHRHKIKGLGYTINLKALSVTYLLTIPFLIPALLRKCGVADVHSYAVVLYHAHMETYFINLFILTGNFIIICLGLEPLKSLMCPFKALQRSARGNYLAIFFIYSLVGVVLLPTTAVKYVTLELPIYIAYTMDVDQQGEWERSPPNSSAPQYCINAIPVYWIEKLRYIITALFESTLIVFIIVVYFCLLVKFKLIARSHRESIALKRVSVTATTLKSGRGSSGQKATAMCLGSMTAFLICNVPSAILETFYLIAFYNRELLEFTSSEMRHVLINVANIMLISNFTLTFVMQCVFSNQYRRELGALFVRGRPFNDNAYSVRYSSVRTRSTLAGSIKTLEFQANLKQTGSVGGVVRRELF